MDEYMDNVERNLLEVFNEMKNEDFNSLSAAIEEYGAVYVFDTWLRHEGVVNRTRDILMVLGAVRLMKYEGEW